MFDTSETLSVKFIISGLIDFVVDTYEGGVRELSMKTSSEKMKWLVFGCSRIVNVDVGLLSELIVVVETR